MLTRLRISKTLLWVLNLLLIFFLLFGLFRLFIFLQFAPESLSGSDMAASFLLGLRYALRWIAVILLPVILVSINAAWSPFFPS